MKNEPRIPLSTYRLQLSGAFTLKDTRELVDYFERLGISDLYLSPVLKVSARADHGYAVIDYSAVDPRLGGEEALGALATALQEREMGLVLDIVPNHMFIDDDENSWWTDLLENGPSSAYAEYFDIEWDPPRPQLRNQVLLPILGEQFGQVLERGGIRIYCEKGAFFLAVGVRQLPVNPRAWVIILDLVESIASQALAPGDRQLAELQSIGTALHHLPSMAETQVAQVEERRREKEIVKERLEALIDQSPEIARAVDEALKSVNGRPGDPRSFDQLEELLERQSYRLCFWRVANDEINYRRFFDVNELACLRIEEPKVFAEVHDQIFRFVRRGWVTGLRVDHVDGLFDPERYLRDLQIGCSICLEDDLTRGAKPVYVIVEKILSGDETLRESWPIHGTSGYDFLNALNGLFVYPEARSQILELYARFTGAARDTSEMIFRSKQFILRVSMASELHVLGRELDRIAHRHRDSCDFTREALELALRDIIACFPTYRSYVRVYSDKVEEEDRQNILRAVWHAKRMNPATSSLIFDFISRVLLMEEPEGLTDVQTAERRHFIMRFQQLTGPVMAKGLEDTAFYRSHPLASLNEVGGNPYRFGLSREAFHAEMVQRAKAWPASLSATSTHDVKRSEDVRARINALSEIPEAFGEAVNRWHHLNHPAKLRFEEEEIPSRCDEYLLYQTLIGTWPFQPMSQSERAIYVDRIQRYMDKATREAKVHTSWINPNELYDASVQRFTEQILNPALSEPFLTDFRSFVTPIQRAGIWNGLSQLTVKACAPGIPDFYQGSEGWSLTLVDPDNRCAVDFQGRRELLQQLQEAEGRGQRELVKELVKKPEDDALKLYLTYKTLHVRRQESLLFRVGAYLPLKAKGVCESHVVAFLRRRQDRAYLVAAGRYFLQLGGAVGEAVWRNTRICLPREMGGRWRNVFTGEEAEPMVHQEGAELVLCDLFSQLPVAILEKVK